MSEHNVVVMAVAAYPSRAAAEYDFDGVQDAPRDRGLDVAAALLRKGADGRLTIERPAGTAEHLTRSGALLGAAMTVLAAPLGILFLAPHIGTVAAWTGIAATMGQLWHHIPKQHLRQMSDLLEAGQAALVVVGVDSAAEHISPLLANASSAIVTDCTPAESPGPDDDPLPPLDHHLGRR